MYFPNTDAVIAAVLLAMVYCNEDAKERWSQYHWASCVKCAAWMVGLDFNENRSEPGATHGHVILAVRGIFYRVKKGGVGSYRVSTRITRSSGYAPSQSGETVSKMRRKSRSAPGARG